MRIRDSMDFGASILKRCLVSADLDQYTANTAQMKGSFSEFCVVRNRRSLFI